MGRLLGNILGGFSILTSLFMWAFILFGPTGELPFRLQRNIVAIAVFSLAFPIAAAWQGSKWWLLMLLSPLSLLALLATHVLT